MRSTKIDQKNSISLIKTDFAKCPMSLSFLKEFKIDFENEKWNYSNGKWNHFFYFQTSDQKLLLKNVSIMLLLAP